jgi:hypothetical protein
MLEGPLVVFTTPNSKPDWEDGNSGHWVRDRSVGVPQPPSLLPLPARGQRGIQLDVVGRLVHRKGRHKGVGEDKCDDHHNEETEDWDVGRLQMPAQHVESRRPCSSSL